MFNIHNISSNSSAYSRDAIASFQYMHTHTLIHMNKQLNMLFEMLCNQSGTA